jgi:hypothetical protein
MKMKKFFNSEEDGLRQFIDNDGKSIRIKFITDSECITRIYYDDISPKNTLGGEAFVSGMFNMRQSNFQFTPIIQRNRQAATADNAFPDLWRD